MTIQTIAPAAGRLDAGVYIPGSKSITNRALLLAALADGISTLSGVLFSDDSHWFLDGLQRLGVSVDIDQEQRQLPKPRCGPSFLVRQRVSCWPTPAWATAAIRSTATRACASARWRI